MSRHPLPVPRRVAWFEGSKLSHRDLADAVSHEARMLALHVRALHDSWGIADGLVVALAADARSATVSAGLAYTCRGESIALVQAVSIAAPPSSMVGTQFDLELSPVRELSACALPDTDCRGELLLPHATLRWSSVGAASTGSRCERAPDDRVHLARFTRLSGGTLSAPDPSRRQAVRALRRPHVATGVTRAGDLQWKQGSGELTATIDTRDGGFTTAPVYFASITSPSPWTGAIVGPFLSVGQATATHFDVHLTLAAKPPAFVMMFVELDFIAALEFAWTGVESNVGCPGAVALLGGTGILSVTPSFGLTP